MVVMMVVEMMVMVPFLSTLYDLHWPMANVASPSRLPRRLAGTTTRVNIHSYSTNENDASVVRTAKLCRRTADRRWDEYT